MDDDAGPRPFSLRTSDGLALEAEEHWPADPTSLVVLAHPHPLQGGSMRSLVTSELFRGLPGGGAAAVRFNFRGVEGSEGEHGGGTDERLDIEAAIDHVAAAAVERRATDVPLVLAGWSFGADVSSTVDDARLSGWFLIAPPLRLVHRDRMVAAQDHRPKRLVVPEHDQFCSPDRAREITSTWTNTSVEVIAGGDHFLAGRTAKVVDGLLGFAADL